MAHDYLFKVSSDIVSFDVRVESMICFVTVWQTVCNFAVSSMHIVFSMSCCSVRKSTRNSMSCCGIASSMSCCGI